MMSDFSRHVEKKIAKPNPQPPRRKRGGGYDIAHVIRKCYISNQSLLLKIHPSI
ncbi:hypothetical protein NIES2100_38360 [Calothrix sp. NIES-2100]|nr:hypothetical protein NIES2100_38360 [Calothrix sp. NIES-2100]